eukprot:scaffold26577_cov22-Cyclotella_meneghiniana.AAC.2
MVFYAKEGSDMIERVEVQHQSLGNTKISSNSIHNAKRDLTDRRKAQQKGKRIGIREILHQVLGYPDVEHSYNWIIVLTLGRSSQGVEQKSNSIRGAIYQNRWRLRSEVTRAFLHQNAKVITTSEVQCKNQDKISMFGVRPVELMEIIASVKPYFEWFTFGVKAMNA